MRQGTNQTPATWIDLRSASGHLLGKYDPTRRLLHIRSRGRDCIIDLTMHDTKADDGREPS